ncbi:MAG: L,D-transpeptidase family protein [Betaproteobacteria bacterium]|jgi:murein L,D-transpeptidase YafK|nr:L,D-transpeptidase family protein [Betaproteobacteria bacterium]MDH5341828.1 L,D-transpeptidase family protein [Betaproteobacteria bacterium]
MKRTLPACALATAIIATALTPSSTTLALGNRPLSSVAGNLLGSGPAGGHAAPEALLAQTLLAITGSQFDIALTEINKVLQTNPNFRLAHLIKGDLLMARARPISSIGAASEAPADLIAELQDEARARLVRHEQKRPGTQVPRYLLELNAEQKYAFVVDTSKYTLYVFENHNGTPRYVADYYTTIGRNGIEKLREGDKKTPLGVYHVTRQMQRDQLTRAYGAQSELYGEGAFPINYPNEWDRRLGRNGHGIWLHGVPFDTYSRPPRASDGCVALTNEDLQAITPHVQVGVTPVIITSGIEWVEPEAARNTRETLRQSVDAWRQDWESRDTGKYLQHYAADFSTGKQDRTTWANQKRAVNAGKSWIKVKVDGVSMFLYPGNENLAVVTFDQDYSSSNISNKMRKRQYWQREGGQWRIVHEGAA